MGTTDRKRNALAPTVLAAGFVLLTFTLATAATGNAKRTASKTSRPTAEQMMVRAHKSRATWKNIPGFTADVIVVRDGKRVAGKLTVTSKSDVVLSLADQTEAKWAERSLKSIVMHRRSSQGRKYDVEFADKQMHHPLGRLIKLNEDRMGSVYRVKGDVITEVHRTMGAIRFTISVMEVARNKEGKTLPRSYSFSTWDVKTGNLKSNTTTHNAWQRVGKFDLPSRLLWITTGDDGKREVRQIVLRKHHLLGTKTAAK
ncbi:MAG: DUF3386 family protein [Planctomycetaceae bacterium]